MTLALASTSKLCYHALVHTQFEWIDVIIRNNTQNNEMTCKAHCQAHDKQNLNIQIMHTHLII